MRFQHLEQSQKTETGAKNDKKNSRRRPALIEGLEQRQLLSGAIITSGANAPPYPLPLAAMHQTLVAAPSAANVIKPAIPMASTITGISPANGSPAGGTVVTITGTNFTGATAVMFGATSATSFMVNSATSITATTPPEAMGAVDVTVTTTIGTSATSPADQFSFGAGPTVATAASANPNPVTTTSTNLSVLGADPGGEPSLTYTWATTGLPPAPVSFSVNGTNAAQNTTATFTAPGSYDFQVTITNPGGMMITSAVMVAVNPTLTTIVVSPGAALVNIGATQQFSASGLDQFGAALSPPPGFTWTVSGGGSISAGGLFTATTAGGPFVVTANSGVVNGTATVNVQMALAPAITAVTPSFASPAGGTTVMITGVNLTGATAVLFGTTPAISFVVNSDTSITATAPAGSLGTVDVTVTAPGGTSAIIAADLINFDSAPVLAATATATPNPVTGTTTAVSVLGADDGGEANLTYTWAATGAPPAPVTFSINGSNAAKNTTATFTAAGVYSLQVTIADSSGLTTTSTVIATVNATLSSIVIVPPTTTVVIGANEQFVATALDQFGTALATQPTFTWTVSGGGTITSAGLFTATTAGSQITVTATSGSVSGTAAATVIGPTLLGQFTSTNRPQKFSAALMNGVELTIKLKTGTAVISQLNNEVYLMITATTDRSTLFIGGTITIADASVSGPLKLFDARDTSFAGQTSVKGSIATLRIGAVSGSMGVIGSLGVVQVGAVSGTLAATGAIKKITVGAVNNGSILSGVNLGANGVFGVDDTYSAGSIGALTVDSPLVNARIEVGVSPGADLLYGTADDFQSGGGSIGKITLFGSADSATRIEAGQFGLVKVPPLNTDKKPKKLANPLLDPIFVIPMK
ncbi:MAG TPA: IPT/TIG domain-containing protein [Tepidisphaeraceae bacterium]|nr:IPT/TIG domain-containing protein [Tepidisphaeraceae bacterium]